MDSVIPFVFLYALFSLFCHFNTAMLAVPQVTYIP